MGLSDFGIFLEHTNDIWNPYQDIEDPMTLEKLVDPLVFVKPEVNDVGEMGEMEEKRKSTKSKRRREEYETANLRRSNRI